MFSPNAAGAQPTPRQVDEERDLSKDQHGQPEVDQRADVPSCSTPPSMTQEDFKTKYPSVDTTVTINVGSNITCHLVGGKIFISSDAKVLVPGVCAENAKPMFMYAGGSWLSESAKVPRYDRNSKVVQIFINLSVTLIKHKKKRFCSKQW